MSDTNTLLSDKKTETLNFFIFGNLLPLMLPLFFLIGYNHYNEIFKFNVLLLVTTALMPLLVLVAYVLYDVVLQNKSKFWEEKKVDYLLYMTAVITMGLIAFQVNDTGGFDNSILLFYFYYIPSAIAISFKKARTGLWLTIVASILSLIYNYHNKPLLEDAFNSCLYSYKWMYSIFIGIHLFTLGILEHKNKD